MIHHGIIHQVFYSLTLSVCNKHLTKMIVANELNELTNSVIVQLIKYIV